MATFAINETARRTQFTSTGQTSYAFNFQVNAAAEVEVFKNDTLQTLTTHYTVSLNSDGTGSISFTSSHIPSSGDIITIIGDLALSRTTTLNTANDITTVNLDTEFDNTVIRQQQIKEITDRSIQLKPSTPRTVTGTGTSGPLQFPYDGTVSNNVNRIIKYDSNGTSLELGPTTTNVDALAAIQANINTIATNIANVNTTATNISAINTVASDLATVAAITSDVTTVAGISSNVTTVAGIQANVTTVASNISSVNTVASDIVKVVAVANDLAETVSEIETVADDLNETSSEIEVVAGSIANVNTVGGAIANVNTAAGNINNINAVAGQLLFTEDLGDLGALTTGSGNDINTVATDITNINTVAGISSNITTVAGISSNVTTVAGISANVTTVASNDSNVTAVAGNSTNINAVAGNATNINTVAGANANITTVATNISGVNSFADRYRVGSSDPTSSLDEGDLFYNSTENAVKYYTGSTWASITAGLGNIVEDTTPQLGGALDGQDNNMSNIGTIDGTNLQIDFGGIT